ncbi:MAG: hypothetical protein HDS07_08330 [Bacteroides sp.]|nr:hypothetical protein [Bacteroides sp.]
MKKIIILLIGVLGLTNMLLSETLVAENGTLVAANKTFVHVSMWTPRLFQMEFMLNQGDSIMVDTQNMEAFIESVHRQSDYVPCLQPSFPSSVYVKLWGKGIKMFKAADEFANEFGDNEREYEQTLKFKLSDNISVEISYMDISGIFYIENGPAESNASTEWIYDLENINTIWSIIDVVSYSKSDHCPIYFSH